MKYFVKKDIKFGCKYVEHVYSPNIETWTGVWMKVGHDVENSPTSYKYLCSSCHSNAKNRSHIGKILLINLYIL